MANKILNILNLSSNKIINLANGVDANDAVNKGQMESAINTVIGDLSSALQYKGTFNASVENFNALTDASLGDFYVVTGSGTVDGIVFTVGDHLIINKNVTGVPVAADVDKIDNTESPDIVRLDVVQTLTNKTIDLTTGEGEANNTITNMTVLSLAEGVLITDLDAAEYVANDSEIATAKAVIDHVDLAISSRLEERVFIDEIVGDATVLNFDVIHEIVTENVIVQVTDADGFVVYPAVKIVDVDTVQIRFGNAPASGVTYTVRILGLE